MAEIYVFHQGKFICRAISQELDSRTISLKEIIAARNQRKKELRANIKNRQSLVDALLPYSEKITKAQPREPTNNQGKHKNNTIKRYQYE